MAPSQTSRNRSVIADINVTPMADVMIVLLIIFMVATPVLVSAPVRLPSAMHASERKGQRLEVVVRSTGEITAGGFAFKDSESLGEWISARRAGGLEQLVLLQADRGVAYAAVAPVLAACRHAGVQEIGLAAERRARP
jgi:biopolymer transport protein TolR